MLAPTSLHGCFCYCPRPCEAFKILFKNHWSSREFKHLKDNDELVMILMINW